jgi:hypothetical protein
MGTGSTCTQKTGLYCGSLLFTGVGYVVRYRLIGHIITPARTEAKHNESQLSMHQGTPKRDRPTHHATVPERKHNESLHSTSSEGEPHPHGTRVQSDPPANPMTPYTSGCSHGTTQR